MVELEDMLEPMIKACQTGNIPKVTTVVDQTSPEQLRSLLQMRDATGSTVLFHAVWNNRIDCMNVLLENGASVDAQNNNLDTPLHLACEKGHLGAVKLLLRHGADADKTNSQGLTCASKAPSRIKKLIAQYQTFETLDLTPVAAASRLRIEKERAETQRLKKHRIMAAGMLGLSIDIGRVDRLIKDPNSKSKFNPINVKGIRKVKHRVLPFEHEPKGTNDHQRQRMYMCKPSQLRLVEEMEMRRKEEKARHAHLRRTIPRTEDNLGGHTCWISCTPAESSHLRGLALLPHELLPTKLTGLAVTSATHGEKAQTRTLPSIGRAIQIL